MIPDAAFRWTARNIVLYAKTLEDFNGAVVHPDRYGYGQLPLGMLENFSKAHIQLQPGGGSIELLKSDLIRVEVLHALSISQAACSPA